MAKEHSTCGVDNMVEIEGPVATAGYRALQNDLLYKLLVEQDSATRKLAPLARGCLDYFPDALLAVALHSYLSNEKHNPGKETHWSMEKSTDHRDCVARHLVDSARSNDIDENGLPHAVAEAWRALAHLQVVLMERYQLEKPAAGRRK